MIPPLLPNRHQILTRDSPPNPHYHHSIDGEKNYLSPNNLPSHQAQFSVDGELYNFSPDSVYNGLWDDLLDKTGNDLSQLDDHDQQLRAGDFKRGMYIPNAEDASTCKIASISSENDQDQKSSFSVDENDPKESEFPAEEKKYRASTTTRVPKVKMKFSSRDEAFKFYKNYASEVGFTARKGKTTTTPKTDQQEKTTKAQLFLCSKEGQKSSRPGKSEPKYTRKPTRTNCEARIKVALKDGEWEITLVKLEHNHELNHSLAREGNKSEAFPNDDIATFRMEEDNANAEVENTHNRMDPTNSLHATKMHTLQLEDVCNLKFCLKHLQEEKQSFCYKFQDDTENQISNFICWDCQSNADYNCFGDVLVLDTTFREEGSGMVCAPFWGIDHHRKCVLFGCGFLHNEAVDSYFWLLKTFTEAVGNGKLPKTFYTDVSEAIDCAVKIVFQGTQHRLNTSYICRNAKKQLVKHFEEPEFEKHFNECIFACRSRTEFESELQILLEKYNLHEHAWLDSNSALFKSWEKWSDWSRKETFSAGIESLFDGDGVGDVIFKGAMSEMTTLDFVKRYIQKAEDMRSRDSVEHEKDEAS